MQSSDYPIESPQASSQAVHSYENDVEVLQLRFADYEAGPVNLNAWELSETLQGVAGFAEEMAKAGVFGEGITPPIEVRPPREGSFVIDFVIPVANWSAENPEAAIAVFGSPAVAFNSLLKTGIKTIKGDRVADFEKIDEDTYKVTWQSGEATEVPIKAWRELQKKKRRTRSNLEKILAPLSSSADVMEIRGGDTQKTTEDIMDSEPIEAYDTEDFKALVSSVPEEDVHTNRFEVEASFESMDFRPGKKWKIVSTAGSRMAVMADDNFQKLLDNGLKIGKDDLFRITIEETVRTKGERSTTEWTMTSVIRTRKGDGVSLN